MTESSTEPVRITLFFSDLLQATDQMSSSCAACTVSAHHPIPHVYIPPLTSVMTLNCARVRPWCVRVKQASKPSRRQRGKILFRSHNGRLRDGDVPADLRQSASVCACACVCLICCSPQSRCADSRERHRPETCCVQVSLLFVCCW